MKNASSLIFSSISCFLFCYLKFPHRNKEATRAVSIIRERWLVFVSLRRIDLSGSAPLPISCCSFFIDHRLMKVEHGVVNSTGKKKKALLSKGSAKGERSGSSPSFSFFFGFSSLLDFCSFLYGREPLRLQIAHFHRQRSPTVLHPRRVVPNCLLRRPELYLCIYLFIYFSS